MNGLDFSGINSIGGEGSFAPTQSHVTSDLFYKLQAEEQARQLRAEYIKQQGENTLSSSHIKSEILKGINEGKPIPQVLFMACQCIATMTNDKGFADMCESKVMTLYPIFGDETVGEMQKAQDKERLNLLRKAYEKQTNVDEKRRIQFAIKTFERKIGN